MLQGIKTWLIFLSIGAVVISSCSKSEDELIDAEVIPTQTVYPLDRMILLPNTIIAVGGEAWSKGISIAIDLTTFNILTDTVSEKRLFSLSQKNNQLITSGIGGILYTKDSNSEDQWQQQQKQLWGIIKDILPTEKGIIAVGGKSLKLGYIYLLDNSYRLSRTINLDQELTGISKTSKGYFISAYGGLLRGAFQSGEFLWEYVNHEGDFFTDILFYQETGIAVGASGSICRSGDNGDNWVSVRSGNAPINDYAWDAIHYDQHREIWIIGGRDGRLSISRDNGLTWAMYALSIPFDIYDLQANTEHIYACGSNGSMVKFNLSD